jgi:hypothetical protein
MVLDATAAQAPYNADDDETVDGTMTDGGSYDARATRIAGAASVTMSHSLSGSGNWAIQAFNLLQAAGGPQGQGEVIASSPPRFPRLMARLRG